MPLKKDPSGRRAVEMELELPGTPEQVWRAMATGPGYTAWFVPAQVEERVGGSIRFEFGPGMTSEGRVTVWEPPFRFGYEEFAWSGEAPPLATEIIVEARAGGTCLVRMVHSLFTDRDDWDDEIAGFESGWPGFFAVLRIYMSHFAGQPAVGIRPTGQFREGLDGAWGALVDRLGLGEPRLGASCRATGDGAPRLAGVVEDLHRTGHDRAVTLRLSDPAPGVALIGVYPFGDHINVAASLYFYGEQAQAAADREGPAWDGWMNRHFPVVEAGATEPAA